MKKNIEEMLLSDISMDNYLEQKMEEEIRSSKQQKKSVKRRVITDLKKVPKNLRFSKKAIYKVYNKNNHTLSFVNGVQAEAMLGMQKSVYQKILNAEMTTFCTDDQFVRFEKIEL